MNFDAIGGRKMVLSVVAIVVGTALFIVKGDISSNLVALLLGVVATFSAGNVASDFAANGAPASSVDAAAPVPVVTQAPVDTAAMDALKTELAEVKDGVATIQSTFMAVIQKLWPQ